MRMLSRHKGPHIEIILNGGLGNQLFGWSTGFAISARNDHTLILNASELIHRPYELGFLGIEAVHSSPQPVISYLRYVISRLKHKFYAHFKLARSVYSESDQRFNPQVFELPSGTTLYGYFQSWKYFEEFKTQIRDRIRFYLPDTDEYLRFKKQIPHSKYLSIHIRRGDYIGREGIHGLTTPEYFAKAIKIIENNLTDPIVCFSDSIELAKEVMPNCTYYFGPESINDPVTLLRAMSEGQAIIGSNSSLSWWAAYLMDDGKPKIFPNSWYAKKNLNSADLIPPGWRTIA